MKNNTRTYLRYVYTLLLTLFIIAGATGCTIRVVSSGYNHGYNQNDVLGIENNVSNDANSSFAAKNISELVIKENLPLELTKGQLYASNKKPFIVKVEGNKLIVGEGNGNTNIAISNGTSIAITIGNGFSNDDDTGEEKNKTRRVFLNQTEINKITLIAGGLSINDSSLLSPSTLILKISGSGNIFLNSGIKTDNLNVAVSGSGNIKMDKTIVQNADIHISGSGHVYIENSDFSTGIFSISGSGVIRGSRTKVLKLKQHISGSGDIIGF